MQITLETLRNKESRDALIDDLIRMMVDGHIVAVLDFIPVEERLPGDMLFRPVLACGTWYRHARWLGTWWFDSEDETVAATHWAEIPEIE